MTLFHHVHSENVVSSMVFLVAMCSPGTSMWNKIAIVSTSEDMRDNLLLTCILDLQLKKIVGNSTVSRVQVYRYPKMFGRSKEFISIICPWIT